MFTYDGVEHANDLNSCHYSALKGVIRFQENKDDWENLLAAYTRALMRVKDIRGELKTDKNLNPLYVLEENVLRSGDDE